MSEIQTDNIRNLAIIAHVDHGKTTLVDELLKQSGLFRENETVAERMMDSMDQERERGITIRSKNTAISFEQYKINIVDTPGHADFGGEVERVLQMVDAALLVVDAVEGPMPQTKFVLRKALSLNLKVLLCINKIDRENAELDNTLDKVFDLFVELGATDEQLEFPVIYSSAKDGVAILEPDDEQADFQPMYRFFVENVPHPSGDPDGPFQFLASTLDYNEYLGRLVIGRIFNGRIALNDPVLLLKADGEHQTAKITKLYSFSGLTQVDVDAAICGDIISLAGLDDIDIGETISADIDEPAAIDTVAIDEPTVSMFFYVNNSPLAGQEGTHVTSRNIRERLFRELKSNVALRVEETDQAEKFKVSGRGELHLSVLIESMRREGFELAVSKPEVIYHEENGKRMEPMEHVSVDVDAQYSGVVIEKLGMRKGEMVYMETHLNATHLEFKMPARSLIGYRSQFLTDTRGTGVMHAVFDGYEPYKGKIQLQNGGVMVSIENGKTVAYALWNLQERGALILTSGVPVYRGQIIGRSSRQGEQLEVNPCKEKKLTNIRSSSSDDAIVLTPHLALTLEQAIEFIGDDELVEVTPKSIRLRKMELDVHARKRMNKMSN